MMAVGIGTAVIGNLELRNTLHVPDMGRSTLVSVAAAQQRGATITFPAGKEYGIISLGRTQVVVPKIRGLYVMQPL